MKKPFVPKTVKEAVDYLYSTLTDDNARVIHTESAVSRHFNAGRDMRNIWRLWDKRSSLVLDAAMNYGIAHADDISSLILDWVWARERCLNFDPKMACKRFHEHWKKYGQTALSVGGFNEDGTVIEKEMSRR